MCQKKVCASEQRRLLSHGFIGHTCQCSELPIQPTMWNCFRVYSTLPADTMTVVCDTNVLQILGSRSTVIYDDHDHKIVRMNIVGLQARV